MYFHYNQPLIYIKSNKLNQSEFYTCRFMFAKPDNGNYIIKIDDFLSMYTEISPEELYSFDDAMKVLHMKKSEWEYKLDNWYRRDDFVPPKYLIERILDTERMIKIIETRLASCNDIKKRINYKKQLQERKKSLRRFHKRTYKFETSKGGCDIHQLTPTDFSKTRINDKIEELNEIEKKVLQYKEDTKNEKLFIF